MLETRGFVIYARGEKCGILYINQYLMSTTADTLQISKHLKNLDFTEKQAEGLAEIVREVEDRNRNETVSKDYLHADLQRTENKLIIWMISIQIASTGLLIATKILS